MIPAWLKLALDGLNVVKLLITPGRPRKAGPDVPTIDMDAVHEAHKKSQKEGQ
jgi:hypothetical protein